MRAPPPPPRSTRMYPPTFSLPVHSPCLSDKNNIITRDKPNRMSDKTCPKSSKIIDTTFSVVCGTNGCFTPAENARAVPGASPCECPSANDGFNFYHDNGVKDGLRYCQSREVYCDARDCGVNTNRTPVGDHLAGWPDYENCPAGYFHNDIVYIKGFPYKTCLLNSLGPNGLKCGKDGLCIQWPDPVEGTYSPNCSYWHNDLARCPPNYKETGFADGLLCDFRMCQRTS